jgi:hypothetical protein
MASNNYIYKMSNAGGMSTITRYTDMLAGNTTWNPWEPAGAYESIATTTVGSTATASITFSGIPSTYTHLQIRYIAKNSVTGDSFSMRFNADTASNYARHELSGFGSSANAYASTSQTSMIIGFENYGTGSDFGAGIIDILDYTSTSKNKTVRSLTGYDANGSGGVGLISGLWFKTPEAITSITLNQGNSGNFKEYSSFALYGIRGN